MKVPARRQGNVYVLDVIEADSDASMKVPARRRGNQAYRSGSTVFTCSPQ